MITVKVDTSTLSKRLDRIQRRQLPFAISQALNNTAFDVRKAEQAQMDKDFNQVSRFTRSAVQVLKATKSNLNAEVFIENKRTKYLGLEVRGGVRKPVKQKLMIPIQIMRNQKDLRPRLLARKGAFEATTRSGTSGVWQARGRGGREIKLLALYKGQAVYKPRYRFYETGEAEAKRQFPIRFAAALARALATAR